MRRALVVLVTGLTIAGLTVPASLASADREVTRDYSMSSGMVTDGAEAHWYLGTEYQVFRAQPGEKHVSLTITDSTGQPARGHIHMDMNGDGKLDHVEDFCTTTADPIAIRPGRKIEVGVVMGTCPDGTTPSIATQGTITATFSK